MIKVIAEIITEEKFKYIKFQALKWKQLPQSYLMKGWRCWLTDSGNALIVMRPDNNVMKVIEGKHCFRYQLEQLEKDLEKCGEHLMKVREGLRKAAIIKSLGGPIRKRMALSDKIEMSNNTREFLDKQAKKEPTTIKVYV